MRMLVMETKNVTRTLSADSVHANQHYFIYLFIAREKGFETVEEIK